MSQLADMGLRSTGQIVALVDSQYGPAALFLLTETGLLPGCSWPPVNPEKQS